MVGVPTSKGNIMGVSVYANYTLEVVTPSEEELDNGDAWDYAIYHNSSATPEFAQSYLGLTNDTWYEARDRGRYAEIMSASYIGYGLFRRTLAGMFGVDPEDYWRNDYTDEPFYEIINFFDNEGMIGPDACKELAKDFEEHRDTYLEYLSTNVDEYSQERYLANYDALREATRRIAEGTGFLWYS